MSYPASWKNAEGAKWLLRREKSLEYLKQKGHYFLS